MIRVDLNELVYSADVGHRDHDQIQQGERQELKSADWDVQYATDECVDFLTGIVLVPVQKVEDWIHNQE